MKILIVTQYFWPESFIINDLSRVLKNMGHNIVIATGKPNYPEGKIFNGYTASCVQKEIFDEGIEVFRVPLRPRGKGGALNLFLNYISFAWSGLRWFPILLKKYSFDAILVFTISPTITIPAIPLKWLKKAHLAIWVQDLWPQSLKATGFIRNRILLKLVGLLVRFTYSIADTILIQSPAFKVPVSRYVSPKKIIYYPNSVDISAPSNQEIAPLPVDLIEMLKTNFCAVFAGNIGTAQAVDTLIETATHLKDCINIKMVLVGSGSMLEWAKKRKSELGLNNLILAGRFLPSAMPELYRHAGCLVVTLKDEEIFSYTVPWKVQSYLSSGKPIIAGLNGEGARVITEAGAGLTCPAEDSLGLANCIKTLYLMPESKRAQLGMAGKAYFMAHFEMDSQVKNLIDILEKRILDKHLH